MYTGTLIDDLMATVERTREQARTRMNSPEDKLAYIFAPKPYELTSREPNLLGVA